MGIKWYGVLLIFALGLLAGMYLSAWQGPTSTNDCVMSKLGDMQSDTAADYLFTLCIDRFGRL